MNTLLQRVTCLMTYDIIENYPYTNDILENAMCLYIASPRSKQQTKPHDRYALNQVIVATRFRRLNKICFWKLWYTKRSMEKLRKAWNTHIVVVQNNSDNGKSSAGIAWGYILLGSWLALRIRTQGISDIFWEFFVSRKSYGMNEAYHK